MHRGLLLEANGSSTVGLYRSGNLPVSLTNITVGLCKTVEIATCRSLIFTEYLDLWPLAKEGNITERFLNDALNIIIDYLKKSNDRSEKVLDFNHPRALKKNADFQIQLDGEPSSLADVLDSIAKTLKFCVKTGKAFEYCEKGL